jgi:hypothetical protein
VERHEATCGCSQIACQRGAQELPGSDLGAAQPGSLGGSRVRPRGVPLLCGVGQFRVRHYYLSDVGVEQLREQAVALTLACGAGLGGVVAFQALTERRVLSPWLLIGLVPPWSALSTTSGSSARSFWFGSWASDHRQGPRTTSGMSGRPQSRNLLVENRGEHLTLVPPDGALSSMLAEGDELARDLWGPSVTADEAVARLMTVHLRESLVASASEDPEGTWTYSGGFFIRT